MCGISGIVNLQGIEISNLDKYLEVMNDIQKHRGPDGNGIWSNNKNNVGFGHTRLSIIDLDTRSNQPLVNNNLVITFNGEIYNYKELKNTYLSNFKFITESDTEVLLGLYNKFGSECLKHLIGMFSFSIYDINKNEIFCARDRLGVKPFYYLIKDNVFYFASEVKTLIPFLDNIVEDMDGISEYLFFNFPISENTMIKGIKQLLPGHYLHIKYGKIKIQKYWDTNYTDKINLESNEYINHVKNLIENSISLHTVSDVPISSYVSGGIDSGLVSVITHNKKNIDYLFHGKFSKYPECDESQYADRIANQIKVPLITSDITCDDFINNISDLIYYLDYPVAGPGSFPQYILSKKVSQYTKVVLGGQGGDEIFGGYTRYILPYFEKVIEEAIDGNSNNLINLLPYIEIIKKYKPMLKSFWQNNLFENLDVRYFDIINRTTDLTDITNWNIIDKNKMIGKFNKIFNNDNFADDDFFNKMLDFDLKYSLAALLHVEDRVSMANSLESRVPLINHKIIEYMQKIPEDIKINAGNMKYLLKTTANNILPEEIINRKDKMGFPVPLNDWYNEHLKSYFIDIITSLKKRNLNYLNITQDFIDKLDSINTFSRKIWMLISLEIWYQQIFDKFNEFKDLIK